jgi:abelson tyrosine-protein kinase 1
VYSSQKTGQPWGTFTTDDFLPERGGPSYHEEVPGYDDRSSSNKVSIVGGGCRTLLVAKLRFKPDVLEPTSL